MWWDRGVKTGEQGSQTNSTVIANNWILEKGLLPPESYCGHKTVQAQA